MTQRPPNAGDDLREYALRLRVRARRTGDDTPRHRHRIVSALKRRLGNGYTVELCEIVSSSIPLGGGRRWVALLAAALLLVGARPLAAQGTAADTALAARHKAMVTDSLRLERQRRQGVRVTVLDRLTRRSDSLLSAHLRPVVVPPLPVPQPPPLPATDTTLVTRLIGGPLPTVAQVAALGGVYAQYEADFATYDEPQWRACTSGATPLWECDYYDRAAIYYTRWQRTGDAKYLDRANRVALDYRTRYAEPVHYVIAHHWSMTDGLALHYAVTGDRASLTAVGAIADYFAWQLRGAEDGYVTDRARADNRIQAYYVKALLDAYLVQAPSAGIGGVVGIPGGNDWPTMLRKGLDAILATRDSDGQWRGAKCGTAGRASHPFTVGLLYDALVRYYTLFEADPRIPAAIKQSADVMWRDDWLSGSQAFKYVGINCPGEGDTTPAPDLNQLIVNGYAFVGKVMGDATFRQRADLIFAGGVRGGGVTGDAKHFNQQYSSATRYLGMR